MAWLHECEHVVEEGVVLEFAAYVRREGRITLPKEVRDALSIDEGCLVRVKVEKVRSQR
jgi:AbrB family looped-hinge helix DNA binding protein